jgi:polysaccharide pyruvyl transferase WcaK-like protein
LSTTRRVVRIHGAFEVENFGDVLLMQIFANWVRELGWEPYVQDAPSYIRRELGLQDDVIGEPEALLFVGGGYLGEPNRKIHSRWRWGFALARRHLALLRAAKDDSLPYALIGVGLGPISNLLARAKTRQLLSSAHSSVLRDAESAAWAKRYKIRVDDVTADAAVSLGDQPLPTGAENERSRILSLAGGRKVVALQLDHDASHGPKWEMLFDVLEKCLAMQDLYLLGISDQSGTEVSRRHKQAAESFLRRFPDSQFVAYDGIDSLLGRLHASDLVITSKLHIGIVASAYGRSVLSLPTHQKTIRFYRQLGRTETCVPQDDWTPSSIANAFAIAHQNPAPNLSGLNELKSKSLTNASYVRQFLESIS